MPGLADRLDADRLDAGRRGAGDEHRGDDRFSATLTCALTDGWDWGPALELAAAATHCIRTRETATGDALRASL